MRKTGSQGFSANRAIKGSGRPDRTAVAKTSTREFGNALPTSGKPDGAADRLLVLLLAEGAFATTAEGLAENRLAVFTPRNGVSLRTGTGARAAAEQLVSSGAAHWQRGAASGRLTLELTEAGRARGARLTAGAGVAAFLAQHADYVEAEVEAGGVTKVLHTDASESPLAWLATRKDRNGRTLIDSAAFQAGERLRADLTLAQMMPRVTANWTAHVASGARGSSQLHISEVMIAARQRVTQALDAAGPEFSGLLMDVCGFLKGLELVESERGWPRRSAKLILVMALARLARHYGYASSATGPAHARATRHWGAQGYRPSIDGETSEGHAQAEYS